MILGIEEELKEHKEHFNKSMNRLDTLIHSHYTKQELDDRFESFIREVEENYVSQYSYEKSHSNVLYQIKKLKNSISGKFLLFCIFF